MTAGRRRTPMGAGLVSRPRRLAAHSRRCAGWSRRRGCRRPTWCCPCSSRRASASRHRSRRCPESCSTRAIRCARLPQQAVADGVGGLILFGIPAHKDARGSGADDPAGIVQLALARSRCRGRRRDRVDGRPVPRRIHRPRPLRHRWSSQRSGEHVVDNDATLERYASIAAAQASAGAHVVAPSGMMDGQVAAIRAGLDSAGFSEVAILAYAAKYASAFYGPFRDAAECAPQVRRPPSLPARRGEQR